jgi:hypothetical protein
VSGYLGELRPECHLVVFDVNVYLDVARLIGEPYDPDQFDALVAQSANAKVPHPDPSYDSLRALATCQSGNFDGSARLEVWTSDHIEELAYLKAIQPIAPPVNKELGRVLDEDRGLGWSEQSAQSLVDNLIGQLVYDFSAGDSVGEVNVSYGAPPLSHEDGCVYATAKEAGTADYYYQRYCVTRDKDFLQATLPGDIEVMHPSDWVNKVRSARRLQSMKKMNLAPRP